ncbi:sigma-70 family RNA polymerase sigma factor [Enterococcus faecalis]|uniref:sigma-70 family RNA polymerase sigma factor n=1 Tax=Enterococcus faecalis TaxID=1351 RepID=UPI00312BED1A
MKNELETTYLFIRYIQQSLIHEKQNYIRNQKKWHLQLPTDEVHILQLEAKHENSLDDLPIQEFTHLEDFIENLYLSNSIFELNYEEKFILYKKFILGSTDAEIAKELHVTSQAISKRKRHILKKIKRTFPV